MRGVRYSGQFKRDVALAKKRGKDMQKLKQIMELLIDGAQLPANLQDHSLRGNWKDYRDLHIQSDWVLVYRIYVNDDGELVHFEKTGPHAEVFKK